MSQKMEADLRTVFETRGIDVHHGAFGLSFVDCQGEKNILELFPWLETETIWVISDGMDDSESDMVEAKKLFEMMMGYAPVIVSFKDENGADVKIAIAKKGAARIRWINEVGGISYGSIG
jgi:hypothetical protein